MSFLDGSAHHALIFRKWSYSYSDTHLWNLDLPYAAVSRIPSFAVVVEDWGTVVNGTAKQLS